MGRFPCFRYSITDAVFNRRRTSRVKCASPAEEAAADTPGTARAAAPTLLCTRGCVLLQAIHGKAQAKMREAASNRKGMRTIHPPSGIGS